MKDISQYPISDPYGATYSPWSASKPHLGDDRTAPKGTPVIVNGVTIGLVGTTGMSSGNHLHVQHVKNGAVVKPETPFNLEGVVSATGENNIRGKYVDITSGSSVYSYFHLSEINVTKGQVIGGNDMSTVGPYELNTLSKAYFGYPADDEFIKAHEGTESNTMIRWCEANPAHAAYRQQLEAIQTALLNEQNKPPREVVKEIEKIVEVIKEIEVVKTVEVEPSWLVTVRDAILKFLKLKG